MAILLFYQGRPVKRMTRRGKLVSLLLYSVTPGPKGEQLLVSQEDWNRFGRVERQVGHVRMTDIRRLAR